MPSRNFAGFISTGFTIVAIMALATLIVGCSEEESEGVTDPPPQGPNLTSPDAVYLHYEDCTAKLDIDDYRILLDEDFQFVETDLDTYGYATEITTMDNIFAGRPGQDEHGDPEAPITSISFQLTPVGAWQNIPVDDAYFGGQIGQWRDYNLMAAFERAADTRLEVSGQVRMYVKQVEVDGETVFRALGFRDATGYLKSTEDSSWTEVKSLYRNSG